MLLIRNDAIDALKEIEVQGATDITGFGVAGHSVQMASASGYSFEVDVNTLVWLDGAKEFLEQGYFTRSLTTNEAIPFAFF